MNSNGPNDMESAIQTTDMVVTARNRCYKGRYHHALTTRHVLVFSIEGFSIFCLAAGGLRKATFFIASVSCQQSMKSSRPQRSELALKDVALEPLDNHRHLSPS